MSLVNKKPQVRKGNLVQRKKLGLKLTMNGLGKPLRKTSIQKIKKKQ